MNFVRDFSLQSEFEPSGDQVRAIEQLSDGLARGLPHQVLMGVTGSGKTFTMANVIAAAQRPVLVISHNKTLAAQLYQEFRRFFPRNAVEYFVSYYDYYQPEAFIPSSNTYIAKEATINDEIDRLRLRGHEFPVRPAGRDHRRLRVLHLRHRRSGDLLFDELRPRERTASRPQEAPGKPVRHPIRAAATSTSSGALSASAAMSSRSTRPTRISPAGSNSRTAGSKPCPPSIPFSEERWTRSTRP